jgi:hypothetical protein
MSDQRVAATLLAIRYSLFAIRYLSAGGRNSINILVGKL